MTLERKIYPNWKQEHTDTMLEARDRGLSAREIANLLNGMYGTRYTRNSVLGKYYREIRK
jgi:hypothetical protein